MCVYVCVHAQSHMTLCNPMDCSPPGYSVHGIFQARILVQAAISFSRGSFLPRNQSYVSCVPCIGRQILYHWEALYQRLKIIGKSTEKDFLHSFREVLCARHCISERDTQGLCLRKFMFHMCRDGREMIKEKVNNNSDSIIHKTTNGTTPLTSLHGNKAASIKMLCQLFYF